MSQNLELKAYQELARLHGQLLSSLIYKAKHTMEYFKDNPEEMKKAMEFMATPNKWDHSGLLSKEDKKVLEMLEYLINDELIEIRKRE